MVALMPTPEHFVVPPVAFLRGVVAVDGLPDDDVPEIAIAGRSNVGKSSLINALFNQRQLARASNTPGRTRELNFFDIYSGQVRLVDLPGYGYAKAGKQAVAGWNRLIYDYLRGRVPLRLVWLLVDSRHGLKTNDRAFMDFLKQYAIPYQVVLTKCDKISKTALAGCITEIEAELVKNGAAWPVVVPTSAEKKAGLVPLWETLAVYNQP